MDIWVKQAKYATHLPAFWSTPAAVRPASVAVVIDSGTPDTLDSSRSKPKAMTMIRYAEPHLLSDQGSDRGTAYRFSNKSLTLGDRTHVVWTDTVAITKGCTYDRTTGSWGDIVTIGQGTDNHNTPTLTADADGHIHLAYGPHGVWSEYPDDAIWPRGSFKVTRSASPNTLDGLDILSPPVGYRGTYASMLISHLGRRCLTYRGGEHPPSALFQMVNEEGGWTQAREMMRQDIKPGYTHYGMQLVIDADDCIYIAGHFYSGGDYDSRGVGLLKSADHGLKWTDIAGQPVDLPIRWSERTAFPTAPDDVDARLTGMALDPQQRLWTLSTGQTIACAGLILGRYDASAGHWWSKDLSSLLPTGRVAFQGDLSIDAAGRIHVVATAPVAAEVTAEGKSGWGHRSCEVFHLISRDQGETFDCQQITTKDDAVANWFPNLSKSGPHHPVELPTIMFTQGQTNVDPAEGCKSTTKTNIYALRIESLD